MEDRLNWVRLGVTVIGLLANVKLALMTRDDYRDIRDLAPERVELSTLGKMNFRTESLRTISFGILVILSVIHLVGGTRRKPGLVSGLRMAQVWFMLAIPINEMIGRRAVLRMLKDS